jgi:shikimate kinase
LAEQLSCGFCDLDLQLEERFGTSISEVFASHGEAAFRAAEHEELATAVAAPDDLVVALGGGAFCSADNRRLIDEAHGVAVFLDLPWAALRRRLASDHHGRPLYRDEAAAERLWRRRLPDYRRARLTVALDGGETPAEAAVRVAEALEGAACAT